MTDLFEASGIHPPDAPLADRLRPATLDEVVGQDHLLGEGGPIRRMIEAGRLGSMILWGPPGTGKTTIARLLAKAEEVGVDAFAGPGVLITKVDGISARAGIQAGDFIRSINGTQTTTVRALAAALATPRDSWAVEVERDGQRGTLRF